MDINAIAKAARRRRKALGLEQEELHERSGISRATISKIENAREEADESTYMAISAVLWDDPDYLLNIGDGIGQPDQDRLAAVESRIDRISQLAEGNRADLAELRQLLARIVERLETLDLP